MSMDDLILLKDARIELFKNPEKGKPCPCCGRFVKKYRRQIHSTMAITLIAIYHLSKDGKFHHVSEIFTRSRVAIHRLNGGDWAKMSGWGLIEEMPKDPDQTSTRTSGFWRITQKGIDFVWCRIKVPRYMYVYNQKIEGFSDDDFVDIRHCLGKKFNYQELMMDM